MSTTGVVIVTHNSQDAISQCLEAVCKYVIPDSVMVVDNASSDSTVDIVSRYPVRLVRNFENAGFATAVNQGIRLSEKDAILILNPDAVLTTSPQPLREALSDEDVGCAGGRLINPDGTAQRGFAVRRFPTPLVLVCEALLLNRLWFSNPVNWHYRCLDVDLTLAQDVEQPAGAFLMVKRSAWARVRGFDQGFRPVWFEDVDFCRRIHSQGLRIRYIPEAVAVHQGGHSVNRLTWERRQVYWYGNVLKYTLKHFSAVGGRAVCLAILVGITVRGITGMFTERSLKPLAGWWEVTRLAGKQLFASHWKKPLV
jgi:GT2 family glycosyltransferase